MKNVKIDLVSNVTQIKYNSFIYQYLLLYIELRYTLHYYVFSSIL